MLKPLGDRVLVEPIEEAGITAGGVVLPDVAQEKPQRGTVIAVGTGTLDKNGNKVLIAVNEGDEIVYSKYGGVEVTVDGDTYFLLREADILGVLIEADRPF